MIVKLQSLSRSLIPCGVLQLAGIGDTFCIALQEGLKLVVQRTEGLCVCFIFAKPAAVFDTDTTGRASEEAVSGGGVADGAGFHQLGFLRTNRLRLCRGWGATRGGDQDGRACYR